MNLCFLMGRVASDPQVRYTGDGKAIASFSLAVNKFSRNGEDSADFFNCNAFGKTAECIEKYVRKGTKLVLEGSFHNDNYTDGHGVKRYEMKFSVNQLEFCEKKPNGESDDAGSSKALSDVFKDADGFMNTDGLDLPFT